MYDRRKLPTQVLVLLICSGLSAYFVHHTFHGRYGLEARSRFIERSTLLEFELKSLEASRSRYERDVTLLSPDVPNLDLIEELARDVLGFVDPRDLVILKRPRIAKNAYGQNVR